MRLAVTTLSSHWSPRCCRRPPARAGEPRNLSRADLTKTSASVWPRFTAGPAVTVRTGQQTGWTASWNVVAAVDIGSTVTDPDSRRAPPAASSRFQLRVTGG